MAEVELQTEEAFVVAQADVVARRVFLDQRGFEDQRFLFGMRDDPIHVAHLLDEAARFEVFVFKTLEIRTHAVPQHLGLADVDDAPLFVFPEIDARIEGDQIQFMAQGIVQIYSGLGITQMKVKVSPPVLRIWCSAFGLMKAIAPGPTGTVRSS